MEYSGPSNNAISCHVMEVHKIVKKGGSPVEGYTIANIPKYNTIHTKYIQNMNDA